MGEKRDRMDELAARVTELEELFTHQQQTVKDLNLVVTEQYRKIDLLESRLRGMAEKMSTLSEPEAERRTLEDDKPPHY